MRGREQPPPIEAKSLRTMLIERDLDRHWLAAKTGLSAGTIANIASGFPAGGLARAKIEAALGCGNWSKHEEFETRLRVKNTLGFDPAVLTTRELYEKAREMKLAGRLLNRDVLTRLFVAFAQAKIGRSTQQNAEDGKETA
jgi:hypothetical protein